MFDTCHLEWMALLVAALTSLMCLLGLLRAMHDSERRIVLRSACGWGLMGLAVLLLATLITVALPESAGRIAERWTNGGSP